LKFEAATTSIWGYEPNHYTTNATKLFYKMFYLCQACRLWYDPGRKTKIHFIDTNKMKVTPGFIKK